MPRGRDQDNPPILICDKCRQPMDFLATLPRVATLPAAHAYRCLGCRRVDTINLEGGPASEAH